MRTIPADDLLLADTPHARLLRDALRTGTLREVRFERLVEGITALRSLETDAKSRKILASVDSARREAIAKIALAGLDLFLRYAEELPPEDEHPLYDRAEALLSIRQRQIQAGKR